MTTEGLGTRRAAMDDGGHTSGFGYNKCGWLHDSRSETLNDKCNKCVFRCAESCIIHYIGIYAQRIPSTAILWPYVLLSHISTSNQALQIYTAYTDP